MIDEPEGYDLREKRAGKNGDAKQWTPQDALYSTHQRMQGKEVTQFVAYWWEKQPDGSELLHWSNATTSTAEHALILQKGLHALLK